MLFEESDVASKISSSQHEETEPENPYLAFMNMEELFDKLKLLDYELDYIKQMKLRPLNRHYFAIQTNPGEQFFIFSSLSAWLIRQCGLQMDTPQEYDDPNSTIAFILDSARSLNITVDFSPVKLRQGYGKHVVKLLVGFCDHALRAKNFEFKKPIAPIEMNDEELVIEDDAELLLDRIEEEMAMNDPDSETDEDMFFSVDDLHKLNYQPPVMEGSIQTNITNEEWQLEVERVLPSLRLVVKSDNKDWRGHMELIKKYRNEIKNSMNSVKPQLEQLCNNISETMDKINSREKFLNINLDSVLVEYRSLQEQFSKVNVKHRELSTSVMDKERTLMALNGEIEMLKQELQDRGDEMSDGSLVINLKKALTTLKEDVANINIQMAILQHDILHFKLRDKLLMQQKLHSQVYA